ncbi:MAG TPA: methyltransferase domain-containing protein [Ramlibacter sp.]|nr:methyltransferase domain-containing protein [Ramlibacter sp.]
MQPARRQITFATAALPLALLAGCAQTREDFEPRVGQPGKDVIWVPTPDEVVQRMLDLAQVKAGDRLVDLGAGDGKIVIAAAKRGARARGIEFNPDMVALSRRNARAAGVNVQLEQGDIFQADFSEADVLTLFLLPHLNLKLKPILLDMKPGTRVSSHAFDMGDWEPDRKEDVLGRPAYFWLVPAKVAGTWTLRAQDEAPMQVQLQQQYQKLEGHAVRGGAQVPLQNAALSGAAIRFDVAGAGGAAMRFEGTADHGGRMRGNVTLPGGQRKAFTGTRA